MYRGKKSGYPRAYPRSGMLDAACAPLTPRANVVTEYRGKKTHDQCGRLAVH